MYRQSLLCGSCPRDQSYLGHGTLAHLSLGQVMDVVKSEQGIALDFLRRVRAQGQHTLPPIVFRAQVSTLPAEEEPRKRHSDGKKGEGSRSVRRRQSGLDTARSRIDGTRC